MVLNGQTNLFIRAAFPYLKLSLRDAHVFGFRFKDMTYHSSFKRCGKLLKADLAFVFIASMRPFDLMWVYV